MNVEKLDHSATMLKITFCLHRLPSLTRGQFQDYWRDVHAPLVRERAALLRIRRYVQTHTLDHPVFAALAASRGEVKAYDGIAELWLDSLNDFLAGQDDAAVRKAGQELLDDERRFIDLPRSPIFVGQEYAVIAPRAEGG